MATKILNKLRAMAKSPETDLEGAVAESILDKVVDYGGDDKAVRSVISDINEHGCVSGIISELIYYTDTHKFYDKYYEDIENLVSEWESNTGERVMPKSGEDRKNFYAWFGYEQQARLIGDKLGLDI